MGKLSRTKGASFERHVCSLLEHALPGVTARRNLQPQGGRAVGNDVVLERAGARLPLAIECKHQLKPNLRVALLQAESDARQDDMAMAICRDQGGAEWAVLRPGDLVELVGAWLDKGKA